MKDQPVNVVKLNNHRALWKSKENIKNCCGQNSELNQVVHILTTVLWRDK